MTVICGQNNSLAGVTWSLNQSQRRVSSCPLVMVAATSSNGRSGDRNVTVVMETTSVKEMRDVGSINEPESESKSGVAVGGGVEDVYGEDSATEDHFITPWSVSVAR